MNSKNKYIILIILVIAFGLGLTGVTYALLTRAVGVIGGNYNTITSCFIVNHSANVSTNKLPVNGYLFQSSTPKGGLLSTITLNIDSSCSVVARGSIYLMVEEGTSSKLLENGALKYAVYEDVNGEIVSSGIISYKGDILLYSDFELAHAEKNYYVYIWLDGNVADNSYVNVSFDGYLHASAEQVEIGGNYYESILNGADPELATGMIPVTISNEGVVTTADLTSKWYSYSTQQWANAVLVTNESRNNYYESDGETVKSNQNIPESDILAYYVWIPKYSYKMNDREQTIAISFNDTPSGYTEHSAFGWDKNSDGTVSASEKLAGFWVGKFETSHSSLSSESLSCSDENCSNANGLRIKPNVSSKRYDNVSNQFFASRSMEKYGNTFGFDSSEVDSHMIKNSEWGAIAYLSHSQYGINDEVRLNNNSNYITGCGASSSDGASTSSCELVYGGVSSGVYPQSTSGNITGVFDMSGGADEYVMGYYTGAHTGYSTNPNIYFGYTSSANSAGFSSLNPVNARYWDEYTTNNNATACNGSICNGHALSETSGWYNDSAVFLTAKYPWIRRGGKSDSTSSAGLFYYNYGSGVEYEYYSFRTVIVNETNRNLEYEESILNGADPVLTSGLIPIVISEDGTATTADLSEEWYNYESRQWANAVLVDDEVRSNYYESDGETIKINQVISESDILAYYVWIPKYSYKMNGTEQAISISFNSIPSGYIEHPAFNFDGNKPGIWVGKFETSEGVLDDEYDESECIQETCDSADYLRITPNSRSLTYMTVSDMFFRIRSMERRGNSFGLVSSKVDTHMMKNSEWGAVAYLSHSIYGIYGYVSKSFGTLSRPHINDAFDTYNEYYIFTTGYSKSTAEYVYGSGARDIGYYSTSYSDKPGSTTGNITGVFDMSGGADEYVMGALVDDYGRPSNGFSDTANAGFNGWVGTGDDYWDSAGGHNVSGPGFPDSKYYDLYDKNNSYSVDWETACNGEICYGHALTETSGWYDDKTEELREVYPWLTRGGFTIHLNNGNTNPSYAVGMFAHDFNSGGGLQTASCRIVLVVTSD